MKNPLKRWFKFIIPTGSESELYITHEENSDLEQMERNIRQAECGEWPDSLDAQTYKDFADGHSRAKVNPAGDFENIDFT